MILYSVGITESCDGLKSSLRINKSRKHLLCKCNSSANLSYSSPTRYINKYYECSMNCYYQKRLKNLHMQERAKAIQPTEIYKQ